MTVTGPGPVRTPVWRHIPLSVAVPINTAAASPTSTAWSLGTVWLDSIHLTVPRNHAGLTGLAVIDAGQRILPYTDAGLWVIADGLDEDFPMHMQVSPALTVVAYNTDAVYTHTFYLRARIRNLDIVTGGPPLVATPVI